MMMKNWFYLVMVFFCLVLAGCGGSKDLASKKPEVSPKERVFTVMGTDVYRRTGPGTNFAPDGFYKPGERVKVLDSSNREWYQVENPDKTKTWIMHWYLAEYVYGQDKTKPELIILPRRVPGEVNFDIIKEGTVFPKEEIQIYKSDSTDSGVVGKLMPEKRYRVTEFETQCKINKNEIVVNGKKAKLLTYLGEGFYAYYLDGVTGRIDAKTNQLELDQLPQVWARVKTDCAEGWLNMEENAKKLHAGRSTGVFIPDNYPKEYIR